MTRYFSNSVSAFALAFSAHLDNFLQCLHHFLQFYRLTLQATWLIPYVAYLHLHVHKSALLPYNHVQHNASCFVPFQRTLRCFHSPTIIKSCGIDVRYLLIKPTFRQTDFTNLFKQTVKIFCRKYRTPFFRRSSSIT